jgi:ferredoxin
MASTISFSDFLKEGALKEQRKTDEDVAVAVKPFHIEAHEVASEAEVKAFWKRLRHYFRTGERPDDKNGIYVPALIAPYLRSGNWDTEFPYYLPPGNESGLTLESLVTAAMDALFKDGEAAILRQNIKRLIIHFKGSMSMENASIAFVDAKVYAIEKMMKLEVHGEEGERYRAELKQLEGALPDEGFLIDFSHEIPLFILRQNLERIEANRMAYAELMVKRVEELRELLKLDQDKDANKKDPEKGFEFADDMIALDKVQQMVPRHGSSKMTESRMLRITGLIDLLDATLKSPVNRAHLIVNKELEGDYRWKEIFTSSKVTFTDLHGAFKRVEQLFDSNIDSFTSVLIAMRKAELELEGKYDDEVHNDYFNHFKWFKLSADELALFPPVVLITGGATLLEEGMSDFSNLLVSNKPVKVIALTNRVTNIINPDVDWEDASYGFRQELAAIALSHRGAHTLQCAADKPSCMRRGVYDAMASTAPALMHLLIPAKGDDHHVSFLKINAAAAGRFFPYIAYDCHKGSEWGSRFDIASNAQPEKDWATYPFTYLAEDENEASTELPFTYADYKAMNVEKVEELFLVPENMVTDYLVPIDEYLNLDQDQLTGKVPFIWLIDENNRMTRAAIPYMWAQSCKERLDFWNFVQELGGVNSYHVKQALAREKAVWEKDKEEEIKAITAQHKQEILNVQRQAAGDAMARLTSLLLGDGDVTVSAGKPQPKVAKAEPAARVESPKKAGAKPAEAAKKPTPAVAPKADRMEAYVDSFMCTSCNDCTEKYPAIFEYNEDKQAQVKENFKGTFEHFVIAAENCPARCIHPGDPVNLKEPNLEELKKRAAKFN